MVSIKLPEGPTLEFYTVSEKKPNSDSEVIFMVRYNTVFCIIRGYYRTFKTTPGRFVSSDNGSHKEINVAYWANAYYKD